MLVVVMLALSPALADAQAPDPAATLRVTVVDPSGAVIVGARVLVGEATLDTGARGDAVFTPLQPGRYTIQVESTGFEPATVRDVRVRAGENRREVKLAIARLAETVQVGRDPQERASDPRGDAFSTILSQQQIDELPDDPDEMEAMLREMAGPGAVLRVNGFRGGRLPPKSQIQQIRFRRNMFAADMHEPGFVSVDITTRPGLDSWRGSTSLGFRDSALNARNPFAPEKGDEQHERYGFTLNGPLWKQHTSLSLSVDGTDGFDTRTIVAALPSGYFADSIRKPNSAVNVTARMEHALSTSQMLRAELQHNDTTSENMGVGDFDLVERGYTQERTETVLRGSAAGAIGKALYNELRLQWLGNDAVYTPAGVAPAVLVLNAFNAGGAQLAGSSGTTLFTLADDLDIAVGRHAIRTGLLLDAGRYRTDELRNSGGTFTFASLDDYAAARPTTFTRNLGDPRLTTSQAQLALYVQDDIRVRKNLTASAGVRQEFQTHIGGLHLAPRGGITWSPFKHGKTTVRAGGGIFFDWLDAQTYQQGVQLDGTHQRVETIAQPGYPDAALGGTAVILPAGRVQFAADLDQPQIVETIAGVEQTLPGEVRVNAMYMRRRGSNLLRGVDVNAPLNGVRPDPVSGTVTEVQSTGRSRLDAISINVNYARPQQRLFLAANYTLGRSRDEADAAFSLPADNYDLAGELGPSLGYPTHRFMSMANLPLKKRFRLATSLRVLSALPYNITTGRDDNGDTVSNDRPDGVARNSGRGRAQVDLGIRISWSAAFGGPAAPPAGPQVRILRGDHADPLSGMPGGLDGGQKRYSVELYAQAYNALNRTNPLNFSGVLASPFFGQATSAAAPRRIEIGTRFSF